jgi:hypothetical protein
MGEDNKFDALYWANRAADVRDEARKMKDPVAKQCMERFGAEYERLARAKVRLLERRQVDLDRLRERLAPAMIEPGEGRRGGEPEGKAAGTTDAGALKTLLDRIASPNGPGRGAG